MTKIRVPHSWADAVTRILDRVDDVAAAAAVGKCERLVRAWSDPDDPRLPSLDQALALSAAYTIAGGEDAPFLEAFAFQLNAKTVECNPCRRALTADVALVVREFGEACASALRLADPEASPRDAHRAFADAQEADAAIDGLLRRLSSILSAGTVQATVNLGNHQ
ncbi:hypothetical protein U1737_00325 [Sphingomonas sp. LB3N6]|uniref:hypothetical protein n=1 Tax=Sphingomonas fucosidasi TaxID=3096164 RepID=UPI002FC5C0E5